MRKYFGGLVLALVAIAVMVPGTALATHSNGTGPSKDFRVGSDRGFCPTPFGTFPCSVHVNGQSESASGPGVPAQGHWYINIFTGGFLGLPDPVALSGEVVCLTAIGNDAWTRLRIDSSNTGLAPLGYTIRDRATDNGEGAVDEANNGEDGSTGFLDGPGTVCPTIPISVTPIEQGNITNHDGI